MFVSLNDSQEKTYFASVNGTVQQSETIKKGAFQHIILLCEAKIV